MNAPGFLILRRARSARLEGRGNRFQCSLEPPSRRSLRLLLRMRWEGVMGQAPRMRAVGCFVFANLVPDLTAAMPGLRGKLEANAPTAPLSWFRTGGPAQ